MDSEFSINHCEFKVPSIGSFYLHNHDNSFEILLFIRGNAKFVVEGTVYNMNPYDVVIAQSYELHRMCVLPDEPYERYVININNSFFLKNDCEVYKDLFVKRRLGQNNLIPGSSIKKYGIDTIIKRAENYSQDAGDEMRAAKGALMEILYCLNKLAVTNEVNDSHEERIKEIILYINHNITKNITLEEIAAKFFVTKCHLCRMFKKYTGYTVNNYIIFKRILLAKEYHRSGKTWARASDDAGFGDYANFYKHFKRIYGYSPRENS